MIATIGSSTLHDPDKWKRMDAGMDEWLQRCAKIQMQCYVYVVCVWGF